MPSKRNDLYGTFGSVPNETSQGIPGAKLSAQANPNDFGAQVGQAVSNAGEQTGQLVQHFYNQAVEAKVNDDYANKYVPAAASLREQYDSLRGPDKIAGYDNYISNLQKLNKDLTSQQSGIYGQKLMSGQINRHVEGEVFGAKRELVESQKAFSDHARYDMMSANNSMAINNYNNPELVRSVQSQNDNHILMQYIDNGHDPNHPESDAMIKDAQQANTSQMASGMINKAINTKDIVTANNLRKEYASVIPGFEKVQLDNNLHAESIRQASTAGIKALTTGQPLPQTIGAPPSQVQALIVASAQNNQIDPNQALAVLRIESANGQNLGERGTLGQDKESKGKPLTEQADALSTNLKNATQRATEVLGRPSEGWESYAVYQQGVGGGAALLKANPNANAIEVLKASYENPVNAVHAITQNGGNPSMTVSDFLDHIKQVYNDNAKRAYSDFGDKNPAEAIMAPHEEPGVTVQPAASPMQALLNFDKKAPDVLAKINAIPNYEVRAGVMKAYNEDRQKYQAAASAYSTVLQNQAGQLAVDPKFTSMDQVSPEMYSALTVDHPATVTFLENRAASNLAKASGVSTKDSKEYGPKFYDSLKGIWNGEITTPAQLHDAVNNGELYMAGYDKLEKELKSSTTPTNHADNQAQKQFFDYAKKQIIPFLDPSGGMQQKFNDFYIQADAAYEKGVQQGKTPAQLLTSTSPDYIGKLIEPYKPSSNHIAAAMVGNHDVDKVSKEIQQFDTMAPDLFPVYAKHIKDELAKPDLNEGMRAMYTGALNRLGEVAVKRNLARAEPTTVPKGE